MAVTTVVICFGIFMSLGGRLGGDNSVNDETKNMGQAHQPTGGDNGGGNEGGAKALEGVVVKAAGDIQQAEKEQLEQSEGALNSAMGSVGNVSNVIHYLFLLVEGVLVAFSELDSNILYFSQSQSLRIGMGKMLGSNMSDEEVEEIAEEVETKLTESVTTELREDAQEFAEEEVNRIDSTVDTEEEAGQDYNTIGNDVMAQEQDAALHVREEISDAAGDMKAGLRGRAAEIEKEILEERLSLRFGKKVKIVIVDDEIQGVDDLFNGLSSFGGAPANGAGNADNGGYRNDAPQPQEGGYRGDDP
jgi:hypothetical protein